MDLRHSFVVVSYFFVTIEVLHANTMYAFRVCTINKMPHELYNWGEGGRRQGRTVVSVLEVGYSTKFRK